MQATIWLKQTLFLCKRGNLECELLLSAYAPRAATEDETARSLFRQLLAEPEDRLFAWLLASRHSEANPVIPSHYRALISAIRNNYLIHNQ
ncbi:succinate dehydrogenase assembly factor 2 [Thiomicrorhabdus cannonii]|uniref:succinate dehydrogenase assembly factor 2 n=1 Tax=Thiomicrorhabdus cannonii TaxID=2748011 RepID=UPI0015B7FE2A|nr:succinate dehydrogenase assembly factor 2 [Thiomicrorhabdus cannonii]